MNPNLSRKGVLQEDIERLAQIEGSDAIEQKIDYAIMRRISIIRKKVELHFPRQHHFLFVSRYSNVSAYQLFRFSRYIRIGDIPSTVSQSLRYLLEACERQGNIGKQVPDQAFQGPEGEQQHHQANIAAKEELDKFSKFIRDAENPKKVLQSLRFFLADCEHQGDTREQQEDQAFQDVQHVGQVLKLFVKIFKDGRSHGNVGPKRKASDLEASSSRCSRQG